MTRDQFDHLLCAAARITGARELVVIGSCALFAQGDEVASALLDTDQLDLFVRSEPELGATIDAALGEETVYHDQQGVYARAVGPLTPVAPAGWLDRLVELPVSRDVTAACMEPHDLVLAKLVAGRGKDREFCLSALERGLVSPDTLMMRVDDMPIAVQEHDLMRSWIERSVV